MVLDTREREQSDAAYWWLRGTSQGANLQWAPGHDDACLDWPIYEEDHPVDEADQRLRSIERLVGKLQGQESLVLATDLFREIVDRIASKVGALHEYRDLARSMQGALGVEPQALSRMIGTGDDIDAFLAGTATLSEAGKRKLKEANDSLTLLLKIFRRDRLHDVIRRKAEAFGGDTALDWILEGRIAEVADLYDRALTF